MFKITERKLKCIISECIKKRLNEMMQSSFNWGEFNSLDMPKERIEYCYRHLGDPIGKGSSRIVFEIDDHTVLKLSTLINTEQNEREVDVTRELNGNLLLPKIYGYDKYNYNWIWSEKVIPATNEDFIKIMGVPYNPPFETIRNLNKQNREDNFSEYRSDKPLDNRWDNLQKVNDDDFEDENGRDTSVCIEGFLCWYEDKNHGCEYFYDKYQRATYNEWIKQPWFKSLVELCKYQPPYEFRLDNFGIALRGGKPTIVVLDIGWFG